MKSTSTYSSTTSRPRRCMSCLMARGQHTRDCADRTTLTLPVIAPVPDTIRMPVDVYAGVIAARQRVAKRRAPSWRAPVWAMVSIVSGSVLMAVCWLANDPLAQYLWEMTR